MPQLQSEQKPTPTELSKISTKVAESTTTSTLSLASPLSEASNHFNDTVKNDEGWRCWSQVLAAFLLIFNGFGYISSFGIFEPQWTEVLQRSQSDVAWAGSIQIFLLFFIGTISGRLMDAGFFRSLIIGGCVLQVVGAFTTSIVSQYWQLLLTQGVLNGLGNGLHFTPAVTLVSTFFEKRRAFALSLAAVGAPFGGIVFPIIAQQLTPRIGFQWAIRVIGFIMVLNSVLTIVLARPRQSNRVKGPLVEWSAFKEIPYSLFTAGMFLVCLGLYFAYFYISSFGQHVIGLSSYESLIHLIVLNACGVPGRIIPAFLADKYTGPLIMLLPFTFICGILLLSWIAVEDTGGFFAFVVVYGVSANAVQTLFPSSLSSLTKDLTKMGTRIGMCFTILGLACLSGPPIAGILIDRLGGRYAAAQTFGGVSVLIGAAVVSLACHCQRSQVSV